MAKITINRQSFTIEGGSVSIVNGAVVVGGSTVIYCTIAIC